ncbi:hypothetical protein A1D29_10715 [Pasteurellaceae bacterium Orientalotternb1]|nr:hypothetical protein A1D29_10715 [Pasteurellaceae bacterium Orientalotternb1]
MKETNLKFVKKFLSNMKGAVAVEFMLLLIVLVIMFAFMFDLVLMRSTVGKLERTSYSLLNVVKERTQLYANTNNSNLSDADITELQTLAATLLYGEGNPSKKKVEVYLEYLELNDPTDLNDRNSRSIKKGFPITKGSANTCTPLIPVSALTKSSPVSETLRSVPIYQVTVCAEVGSLFQSIIVSKKNQSLGLLRASSHGPIR